MLGSLRRLVALGTIAGRARKWPDPLSSVRLRVSRAHDDGCGRPPGRPAGLKPKVTDLERRLAQNSRNSSRSPSSDGLSKPPPKSLRRPSGRKPGGQDGHRGGHLEKVAVPAEIVDHVPSVCAGCEADLSDGHDVGHLARQVFDLPEIRLRSSEHRAHTRRCVCAHETTAVFPCRGQRADAVRAAGAGAGPLSGGLPAPSVCSGGSADVGLAWRSGLDGDAGRVHRPGSRGLATVPRSSSRSNHRVAGRGHTTSSVYTAAIRSPYES